MTPKEAHELIDRMEDSVKFLEESVAVLMDNAAGFAKQDPESAALLIARVLSLKNKIA